MVQIHVPPLFIADLAQPAEHIHGKDGVFGSNPKIGFMLFLRIKITASEEKFFGAFLMYMI